MSKTRLVRLNCGHGRRIVVGSHEDAYATEQGIAWCRIGRDYAAIVGWQKEGAMSAKHYKGYEIATNDVSASPYLIDGKRVTSGFMILKDGANVAPGAAFFTTIDEAQKGIDALIATKGDSDKWWAIMQGRRGQA